MPSASVIIPAHDEERTIGRLLSALLADAAPDEFEIIVVCNGCSDGTADVARGFGPAVQVVEVERPSKHWALIEGDRHATAFPRLYVDADVELDTAGARALVAALDGAGVRAVAPERDLVLDRSSRVVRSYYRVWGRLPVVRTGLFGRGVVGLDAEGHRRLGPRPEVLGDDLFVHSRFAEDERCIVAGARSRVRAPHRAADLVRRRTRAAEGNTELAEQHGAPASTSASARAVLQLARREPALWPHLPAFLGITAAGRLNSRRRQRSGGATPWLRDESSRT